MQYDLEERDDVTIVRFTGDLGAADDRELKSLFVRLKREGRLHVVFDMEAVTFLETTSLGDLVWGMKNLREDAGDLRIARLTSYVRRVFNLTGLDLAFRVFPAVGEAVESFRLHPPAPAHQSPPSSSSAPEASASSP